MKILLKENRKFYDFDFPISQKDLEEDNGLTVKIPETVEVKGRLEKGEEKSRLKFDISGLLEYPCSRCLEPVRIEAQDYDFDEELELEDATELDLTEFINDCLFIHEPSSILCKEDCQGLCPVCGTNLNTDTCSCQDEEEIDPRLAALKQLL